MSEQNVKIGAWSKDTSKGKVINFTINGVKYSMWENKFKKEIKHPDYQIYIDNYVPKTINQQEQEPHNTEDLPF